MKRLEKEQGNRVKEVFWQFLPTLRHPDEETTRDYEDEASDAQLQSALDAALAKIPEEKREKDRDGEDDAYGGLVREAGTIDD